MSASVGSIYSAAGVGVLIGMAIGMVLAECLVVKKMAAQFLLFVQLKQKVRELGRAISETGTTQARSSELSISSIRFGNEVRRLASEMQILIGDEP